MDERIIKMKLELLSRKAIVRCWPIGPWWARTADHLAPGEYRYDGDWTRVDGESAWPAGKTLFLRAEAETPAEAPAQDLYLQFRMDGLEGLLSVNGRPYAGIDHEHSRVVVPVAGRLVLEAEFMCLGASLYRPELRQERARLREVAFAQVDREVEAAYYDLRFTWEASREARDERRRQLLHAALEEALLAIDLTAPPERFREEVSAARRGLWARIGAIAPDPEAGRIFLTGHSHIDTAWLWPLRETVRKCGRTFATACRLLERYPSYHFSCSQPQLYAYTRRHFPALYQEIKRWVREGRWECTGGMWVESDCNLPSGESLIRQILHGVRFFQEEFGVRPRTCWLPDVFGYPASLPQILKGCGLDHFMTNKLHWQARNPFPVHLFWWEGIDGTRILAHIPRLKSGYGGWPNPEELNLAWENFAQKGVYPEVLFPFGHGDGGGGPTEEMLEFAARAQAFPGVPTCRQGLEEVYFDDARAASPPLPVWVGELYLETHRGTYTTHGEIKRANRKNELLLREAEVFGVLARWQGADVALETLRPAWETLLLLQFHDILPGSSIGEVYREAAVDHAQVEATARAVREVALRALAERAGGSGDLIAFNSLSWPRADVAVATIPDPGAPVELVQADGRTVPVQVISRRDGQAEILFVPESVPSLGYAAFSLRRAGGPVAHSLRIADRSLENRFFRLELADDGSIVRLLDKRCHREVIPPGQPANRLQLFQDGPEQEAAWNVHATFEGREYPWDPGTTLEVMEQGPVRAVVRITRHYRRSRVEQDLILYDRLPRLDFVTRADWAERQVMLKVAFPVEVLSSRATFEIQFGAVERPTHRNTSWDQEKFEVCGHRWADLSEAGYGVSLLNDCKYGLDVHGNVLRLTLLRGPEWPDPDADRGHHEFTYSLLPHMGDWREGETVRRAWELNVPIACVLANGQRAGLPTARSFLEVEGPAIVQTLKPAEDGDGWILRLYEPHGGRGKVRVRGAHPLRQVVECNHLEEAIRSLAVEGASFTFPIRPFEIKTFRLHLA